MNHILMFLPGYLLALLPLLTGIPGAVHQRSHSLSVMTMVPLLELENKLIDNLDEYANALERKLKTIRSHILVIRAEHQKAQLDAVSYLSHPLNAFSLIRRLNQDWVGWRRYMAQTLGASQIRNFNTWRKKLPTDEDCEDACEGITRIQGVYGLEIADIISGKLHGKQYNVSMSSADIFAMGQHLLKTSRPKAAMKWLEEVASPPEEDILPAELCEREERLIQLLSLVRRQNQSHPRAQALLDSCLEHRPQHRRRIEELSAAVMNSTKEKIWPNDFMIEMPRVCKATPKKSSGLHCFYNFSTTPFLRLAPFKVEQVGLDPYLVIFHDVLSQCEMSMLISIAMEKMTEAVTITADKFKYRAHLRTAKAYWLPKKTTELGQRISRRIQDMTGFDLEESEQLQIINYGIGGHYVPHMDSFNTSSDYFRNMDGASVLGDRIATVLFYLSDVEHGGATAFTKAGYKIYPRAGTALFWYNLHTDGNGDLSTKHTACPVIVGSKWVMTEWIREAKQMFIRPCLPRERGASQPRS